MRQFGAIAAIIVSATALTPLHAHAEVAVADTAARASLVAQINHMTKDYIQIVQAVNQLTQLANLSTIASTVLGESVNPELSALFNNASTAYRGTSQAYGSVMAVPANINAELYPFREPPAGWESLSFDELTQRAERIRRLTAGTQIASVAQQGEFAEHQRLMEQQAARANAMADRSVSALSATQAVAQQARVGNMALSGIAKNTSDMLTTVSLKNSEAAAEDGLFKGKMNLDMQRMREKFQTAYEQPKRSPLIWGR